MFLVVGESLVDLIAEADSTVFTARAGGSPFNVALGLARLGQPVTLVTGYGDDHCGRILDAQLRAAGVAVRRHQHPTSLAIATLGTDGGASYDFRFEWATEHVEVDASYSGLHTGSLAALVWPGREAVLAAATEARRLGLTVSYDPNIRPSLAPSREVARTVVERFVAVASIVKASREDLAWLYPDEDPVRRLRFWAQDRLAVLTDGPRGCVAVLPDALIEVPAIPVDVVDTVGAGDSFMAALLTALHQQPRRLPEALAFATRAAAITCAHPGAYHPTAAEIAAMPADPGSAPGAATPASPG